LVIRESDFYFEIDYKDKIQNVVKRFEICGILGQIKIFDQVFLILIWDCLKVGTLVGHEVFEI
jgi:hypothetical protein